MASRQDKKSIPQLYVEKFTLSELSDGEIARFGRERLLAAQQKLESSNEVFFRHYPADQMVAQINARYARMESKAEQEREIKEGHWIKNVLFNKAFIGASSLAVSVALFLLIYEPAREEGFVSPGPSAHESVRIKGLEPRLKIYRKKHSAVERLSNGARVKSGDVIQLSYVAAGRESGVVFSLDGAGTVTLHWPTHPDAEPVLDKQGEVSLPTAYELDAAPLFERFFFVTAHKSIDVRDLLARARRFAANTQQASSRPLDLPKGWSQTSIKLVKVNK